MTRGISIFVLLASLSHAGSIGGLPSAAARPKYKIEFDRQYPQVKASHRTTCLVCHKPKAGSSSLPDPKQHNNYGSALKQVVRKNELDSARIQAALKQTEREASATRGRTFGDLLTAGSLPAGAPGPAGTPDSDQSSERPLNIVFFLVDDLGYMDVGCNNPRTFYETPHIDRLAASGMRFTDGYAANPVCSPTRYSIMTGKYPTRVAATNFFSGTRAGRFRPAPLHNRMPLEEVTLAEALREHGYATFYAGKWHLGPDETFWPERQGFDINKGGCDRGGPYGGKRYFSPYGNPRLEDGPDGEHLPDRLATETAKFIAENRDRPFLAYLAFHSVHTPLMAPPELVEKYRAKAERLTPPAGEPFVEEEQILPVDEPRRVRTVQDHAVYAGMIESMDRAVGKVLEALDKAGLADNTAVFFMSDNGGLSTSEGSPTSNLPLRAGKGWLYEGGIRVPFLVRWPGVTKPGSTCRVPVISTDFYPTILDMAGLTLRPDQHRDGLSLVPLLRGGNSLGATDGPPAAQSPETSPTHAQRDALYWHYPHYSNQGGIPGGAIRSGDWKLIERFEDGRVQLYNLADDLGEQTDLADRHPDRVAALRDKLHAWYHIVDAKFLQPHPDGPDPWRP
jgi:arylsulfatase A-like enzyme